MNGILVLPYVCVGPQGVVYLGLQSDENDCWQIAFGWPSQEDIEHKKKEGFYVCQATLTWKKKSP